jgi:hypothetical protein
MARLDKKALDRAHKELKVSAGERIAARGVLQFRADSETIKAVLQAADERNLPVGAMLRQWVQDRLFLEYGTPKAPDLVQRVTLLEEAVTDLQKKLATK